MDIPASRYRLRRKLIHLIFFTCVYFYIQIDLEGFVKYQWTISYFFFGGGGSLILQWGATLMYHLGGGGEAQLHARGRVL